MGQCWTGLRAKTRFSSTASDSNNLVESDLDCEDGSDSSVFSSSPCATMKDWRHKLTTSGGHLQSLASKIQSFRVKPGERRLYRGAGHSFAGGEVNTRGLNGDTKYSIFDTPGSDRFHFGSRSGSMQDSMSLEWDPQDCSCRITDNPLQDLAAVSLDPASEQAAFSVWESQHNTAALQEVDLVTPEYETDMMVRQIENITEVTLRETNLWNIQVNKLDNSVGAETMATHNLNKSTISTDANSFSPMSTSLDSGHF